MDDNPTHVEMLARHDRAVSVHDRRLDAHGEQLGEIRTTLATLTEIERQNQQRIDESYKRIDRVDARVTALEARPARRWDTAVTAALTAVAGGLAGYVLAGAGLG